jgi:pyrroloquinoline quinone (PQQ) biosynthesis protein C
MYSLAVLRPVVENHPVIRHTFLNAFQNGELSVEMLRGWLVQQYYFSISLPSCFASLYGRIDDGYWEMKRALVDLLHVEAWGSNSGGCHSRHFVDLAEFLGTGIPLLKCGGPATYTRVYLDARLQTCQHPRPVVEGLAAIGLANEVVNLFIFSAYRQGIRRMQELQLLWSSCPTGYFDAHLGDEETDFEVFDRLFGLLATTPDDMTRAETAVQWLLDQRCRYLDALYADLQSDVKSDHRRSLKA